MFPFGARLVPPPQLPRPIPPFPRETVKSYLYRLAVANNLHPDDLRRHLTGGRGAPITLPDLAAATDRSEHGLGHALPELRPDAETALAGHIRRTVCHRCAARRDAFVYAVTWQPAETMLCSRHLVWIGPEGRSHHRRQYDVAELTDIVRAQHRHRKLAGRVGREAAAEAFADAAHITELWARRGLYRERRIPLVQALLGEAPLTRRMLPSHPINPVVTYPETVDLAYVLADPRWRYPRRKFGVYDYAGFHHDINNRLGIRYTGNDPHDPIWRWCFKRQDLARSQPRRKRRST
jgi:hypothetical protein